MASGTSRHSNEESTTSKKFKPLPDLGSMVIESMELINFMCHAHFKIHFNKYINFIVGQNGSGKSAVLCALILAFGGSVHFADRGKSHKSLIKDGARACTIRITINNTLYPYKKDLFGDRMTIERRFDLKTSSWALLNDQDVKVYGDKKRILDMIEHHFNIIINNPLNVLTQEMAKRFLFSSTPYQKYQFFKKATRLSEVEAFLKDAEQQFTESKGVLVGKKESLKTLEAQLNEAQQVVERLQIVDEFHDMQRDTVKRIKWRTVRDTKERIGELRNTIHLSKKSLADARSVAQDEKDQYEKAINDMDELKSKLIGLTDDNNPNNSRSSTLADRVRGANNDMRDAQHRLNDLKSEIKREEKKIAFQTRQIEKENQEDQLMKLKEAFKSMSDKERHILSEMESCKTRITSLDTRKIEYSQTASNLRSDLDAIHTDIRTKQEQLKQLSSTKAMAALGGPSMHNLMQLIEKETWQHKPIGPIGQYLSLNPEYKSFQRLLDAILGNNILDFLCFDQRDRQKLSQLVSKCQFRQSPSIIYRSQDLFDWKNGMADGLCIAQVLQVSNEYVMRHLIDTLRIEQCLLFMERAKAEQCVANGYPKKVSKVYYAAFGGSVAGYDIGSSRGGKQSKYLSVYKDASVLSSNQQNKEAILSALKDLQANKTEKDGMLVKQDQHIRALDKEYASLMNQLNSKTSQQEHLKLEKQKIQKAMDRENSAGSLVDLLDQAQRKVDDYKNECSRCEERIQELQEQILEWKSEIESMNRPEKQNEIRALQQQINQLESDSQEHKALYAQNRKRVDTLKAKNERDASLLEDIEGQLEDQIADAKVLGDVVDVSETTEELMAILEKREAEKLKIEEREQVSYEDANDQLEYKQAAYDEVLGAIQKYDLLLKTIKKGLALRKEKLQRHLQNVTATTKQEFSHLLKKRNYRGALEVNHEEEKLDIQVAVENDMIASIQTKRKMSSRHVKSLSGGEKSFASICFLCSLWRHVPSPLRCLDESFLMM